MIAIGRSAGTSHEPKAGSFIKAGESTKLVSGAGAEPEREDDPRARAEGRREAGVPAGTERSGSGAVLRLVPGAECAAPAAAAESASEGAEVRAGARGRSRGASVRRRRGAGYQPSRKGPARVGRHPASRAVELTPRVWRTLFAEHPLRSDLDRAGIRPEASGLGNRRTPTGLAAARGSWLSLHRLIVENGHVPV